MEISRDFIENSILNEFNCEFIASAYLVHEINGFFPELIGLACRDFAGRTEEIVRLIENLKQGRYSKAMVALRGRDQYCNFPDEIGAIRLQIKYLLSGFLETSSLADDSAFQAYKKKWDATADFGPNPEMRRQKQLIREFIEVHSHDGLDKFNLMLKEHLEALSFRLSGIVIEKMRFTIQYLQPDSAFEAVCAQATVLLEKFSSEIELLK